MLFDGKRDDDPFDYDDYDQRDLGSASSQGAGRASGVNAVPGGGGRHPGASDHGPVSDPYGFGEMEDPFADTQFPGDLTPEELRETQSSPFQNGSSGAGRQDAFAEMPQKPSPGHGSFADFVGKASVEDDEDFGPRQGLETIFSNDPRSEDDFYQKREDTVPSRKKWPILVGLGAIALFGGIIYYAYTGGGGSVDPEQAPLISAIETPYKTRPLDRGGETPKHQGVLVYDRTLGEGRQQAGVENLMAPPETPVRPPQPAYEPVGGYRTNPESSEMGLLPEEGPTSSSILDASVPPLEENGQDFDRRNVVNLPPPAGAEAAIVEPAPADMSQRGSLTAEEAGLPEQPRQAAVTPKPKPQNLPRTPAATAKESGDYRVQLSSLRSADLVKKKWKEWQKTHSDLLGGLTLNIQKADLGSAKGVYYRMKTNGMPKKTAQNMCRQLKGRGLDCIVIRK